MEYPASANKCNGIIGLVFWCTLYTTKNDRVKNVLDWSLCNYIHLCMYHNNWLQPDNCNTTTGIKQTRNMGQSPTWGRPAPEVRLEIQFMGLVRRVKIWGTSAPRGRNIVSRKSAVGWVNMRAYNFVVCGPKFTNRGWNVVDEVLFRFSICCSVPEIFAIKFQSCYKSRWILDVFYPAKFCRGHPCKTSVHVSHIPW